MSLPNRQSAQHGFPIPFTFDQLPSSVDFGPTPAAPSSASADSPKSTKSPSNLPRSPGRWRGLLKLLLLLVGLGLVVGPWLVPLVRRAAARHFARLAEDYQQRDRIGEALTMMNRAVGWQPGDGRLLLYRASIREELNDLSGALDDLERALRDQRLQGEPYPLMRRSIIWQRMALAAQPPDANFQAKAIDEAERALPLCAGDIGQRASLLNQLAYARAVAHERLDRGLEEIDEAITLFGDDAAFLDTRGYLLHQLDRQEKALKDLTQAIRATEALEQQLKGFGPLLPRRGQPLARQLRQTRENLAVMHYHRALVYDKLEMADQARAEHKLATDLGYSPEKGVF